MGAGILGIMYLGAAIYWRILAPLINFLMLSDDNYKCGLFMKRAYAILTIWQEVSIPFVLQACFIGIIWQLARIQATLLSRDFESEERDSSEFSVDTIKQLRDTVATSLRDSELTSFHTPGTSVENSFKEPLDTQTF